MKSAFIDPEMPVRFHWAAEGSNTPMFVRTIAEAALIACSPDCVLLRPVILELKRGTHLDLTVEVYCR
jgi:hypothetical protein